MVAGFEKPQGIKCFKDSGMALRYVFALHKKYNAVMPRSLCLKIARQAAEEKKALKE